MVIATNFHPVIPHARVVAAVDVCVALKIKTLQPVSTVWADPSIDITTTNLTFYKNYDTGAVVDDDIGTSGVVDLTNGGADYTVADLVTLINASANWRATAVASLGSSQIYDFGTTTLMVVVTTAGSAAVDKVRDEDGASIFFDTSGINQATACLGVEDLTSTSQIEKFVNRVAKGTIRSIDQPDILDWKDTSGNLILGAIDSSATNWISTITRISETGSVASGSLTSTVKVYSVDGVDTTKETLIFESTGGADATEKVFDYHDLGNGLMGLPGQRLVAILEVSGTTPTTTDLKIMGEIGIRPEFPFGV